MRIPYDSSAAIGREYIALAPEVVGAILLTLQAGWTLATFHPEVRAEGGEVEMTERLRDGMRSALSSGRLPWAKSFIVAPGTESRSTLAQLQPDGRTDISIYLIEIFLKYGEHDPHAIVECKRLSGANTHLCREYVVEGVDRFRTAKYAENHATGFMAGYLLAGDAAAGARGLNAYFSRVGRSTEAVVASDVLTDTAFWRSSHPRTIPRAPIDLHHALLEVGGAS